MKTISMKKKSGSGAYVKINFKNTGHNFLAGSPKLKKVSKKLFHLKYSSGNVEVTYEITSQKLSLHVQKVYEYMDFRNINFHEIYYRDMKK